MPDTNSADLTFRRDTTRRLRIDEIDGNTDVLRRILDPNEDGVDELRMTKVGLQLEGDLLVTGATGNSRVQFLTADKSQQWNIQGTQSSGALTVRDAVAGTNPFVVEAGAPSNALVVKNSGLLGVGTAAPIEQLHVRGGDETGVYVESTDPNSKAHITVGNDAQRWGLRVQSTDVLGIWDVNTGAVPIQIKPGAPQGSVWLDEQGHLGLKTVPSAPLDMGLPTAALEVEDAGTVGATETAWVQVQVGGNLGYIRVYGAK